MLNFFPGIAPSKPVDGVTYCSIENKLQGKGDISQICSCPFVKSKCYIFSVYAASLWGPKDTVWSAYSINGKFKVLIGTDSCMMQQQVYISEVLDSAWHKLFIAFTPDSTCSKIGFWPVNDSLQVGIVDIALDALSPIYLINANAVHVANKDTVVYTQPNEQKCISMKATSTITTYDTVRWYKLVDTVKVPVAAGLQASVCVDSNTTFLIGLRDSVVGCAGVEWSWDTLRVWVRDTVLGVREVDAVDAFSLQPNPVVDVLTITPSFDGPYDWTITDALGRLSAKGRGRNTTEVPLQGLSRGAYLLQVEGVVLRFLKE
ncbi:MAG: T9SS type A sorting domain-containing protein [Chitinophagales bacterium]